MVARADQIAALRAKVSGRVERSKALTPSYGKLRPSLLAGERRVPGVSRSGGRQSIGYSYSKALALSGGVVEEKDCPEEVEVSRQMERYAPGFRRNFNKSILVPVSSNPIYFPDEMRTNADGRGFMKELREKMLATAEGADFDEVISMRVARGEDREKALGTFPATAGGTLIPPPMLSSEIIDLQRFAQVFTQLGAREVGLPPQGTVRYARQTGAATGYWVGEAQPVTDSTLATGDLELNAKKLAVLSTISDEALRFSNPSAEALVRQDFAEVGALLADLAMLQGTGGTQIKGLITYTGDANAYLNIKTYIASVTGGNGDTFQPNDVLGMIGVLPDAVRAKELRWAMAPTLWAAVANRRADAVTAGDGKGPFMFNVWRGTEDQIQTRLDGRAVVTSGQISTTRTKGVSTLTYALLGHFPDWLIGRYGAMEMLLNPYGTGYVNAQVQLRAIQYIDAGPRTPNSFVICDTLVQA